MHAPDACPFSPPVLESCNRELFGKRIGVEIARPTAGKWTTFGCCQEWVCMTPADKLSKFVGRGPEQASLSRLEKICCCPLPRPTCMIPVGQLQKLSGRGLRCPNWARLPCRRYSGLGMKHVTEPKTAWRFRSNFYCYYVCISCPSPTSSLVNRCVAALGFLLGR